MDLQCTIIKGNTHLIRDLFPIPTYNLLTNPPTNSRTTRTGRVRDRVKEDITLHIWGEITYHIREATTPLIPDLMGLQ